MTMLTSLAALALGAVPVQSHSSTPSQPVTGPVKVEVTTQTAPAISKPVWKPKPKHWLGPDGKLAAKLPAPKL
jgi:hypothetical protein